MLRNVFLGASLLLSAAFVAGIARSDPPKGWSIENADVRIETSGKNTVVAVTPKFGAAGFAWLEGAVFREGTIEVDLKGHGEFGIVFGGEGREEILFETDGSNRVRNVSYASPFAGGGVLTDSTSAVKSSAPPKGWTSVKIAVEPKTIRVFLDGSAESCFTAMRDEKAGPVRTGIMVRPQGDASFMNFKVTPLDDALPKRGLDQKEKG